MTQTKLVTLNGPRDKSVNPKALCFLFYSGLHRQRFHVITSAVCGRPVLPGGHAAVCVLSAQPLEPERPCRDQLYNTAGAALLLLSSSSSAPRSPHPFPFPQAGFSLVSDL